MRLQGVHLCSDFVTAYVLLLPCWGHNITKEMWSNASQSTLATGLSDQMTMCLGGRWHLYLELSMVHFKTGPLIHLATSVHLHYFKISAPACCQWDCVMYEFACSISTKIMFFFFTQFQWAHEPIHCKFKHWPGSVWVNNLAKWLSWQ